VLAFLSTLVYGGPLRSGYGATRELFSVDHVLPNAVRYARWLVELHTPWILIGIAAPFVLARRTEARRQGQRGSSPAAVAIASLGVTAALAVVYLPYVVFDNWSYLRFFLPAVPLLIALACAVTRTVARRLPRAAPTAALAGVTLLVGTVTLRAAQERAIFNVRFSEARYAEAGTWIRDHTPARAVVLAVWHSGSVRLYGDRFSVLWDAVEPADLDEAVRRLRDAGRPCFVLLESWEMPRFRTRFTSGSAIGALDWPPRAQIGRDLFVYEVDARDRYLAGGVVQSERVWTSAERAAFRR
jgi:hypothetical protein